MERRVLFFPVLSGVLAALAFLPHAGFLAWVALMPMFYCILYKTQGRKQAGLCSILFGLAFYMALLTWIFRLHPLVNAGLYGIKSAVLVFLAWAFMSVILAVILAAALFLLYFARNAGLWAAPCAAALFVLAEWLQGIGVLAMPWGRLAVSQYLYPAVIKSAAFFGPLFITFVIVLFNVFLAMSFKNKKCVLAALLVFSANILVGMIPQNLSEGKAFTAAAVWVDVPPSEKMEPLQVLAAKDKYISLSKKAAGKADLVLWPETAVPVNPYKGALYIEDYKKLARDSGAHILASGYYMEEGLNYSVIFGISPEASSVDVYGKRQPVIFGEYIPFRPLVEFFMPSIDDISPIEEEISPWRGDGVMDTEHGKVGGLICFDSVFTSLARQSALAGAEVLCVSTNDSWFYGTAAIDQHMAHSVLRAVENGRYVVRSANMGVSCVITPWGIRIENKEEGFVSADVRPVSGTTLYTRGGDAMILIFCLLILGVKKCCKIL